MLNRKDYVVLGFFAVVIGFLAIQVCRTPVLQAVRLGEADASGSRFQLPPSDSSRVFVVIGMPPDRTAAAAITGNATLRRGTEVVLSRSFDTGKLEPCNWIHRKELEGLILLDTGEHDDNDPRSIELQVTGSDHISVWACLTVPSYRAKAFRAKFGNH